MQKLEIPKPCGENFSSMPRCGNMAFCSGCKKTVTDLSSKNLAEVHVFLNENPQECVRVKTRHIEHGRRMHLINRFEVFLHRFKIPAFSSFMIGMLLLVSGCHHRKPRARTIGFLKQHEIVSPDNNPEQ